MRCYQFYAQSDGEATVRVAQEALELLAPDDLAERGFAMLILGAAMQMVGNVKDAKDTVYSAMAEESVCMDGGSRDIRTRLWRGYGKPTSSPSVSTGGPAI